MKPQFDVINLGFGQNRRGYPGAFPPKVEEIIKSLMVPPCLHLFSGVSELGDVRIDLDCAQATRNMDVRDFIRENVDNWRTAIVDPPWGLMRHGKKLYPMSSVPFRRELVSYLRQHVEQVIWLDVSSPCPKGFSLKKVWFIRPGGWHHVRALNWLINSSLRMYMR